jgi:hypothetical protein
MKQFELKTGFAALVLAGIYFPVTPFSASATTYGGRATGCTLDTPSLPPMTACDTGEMPLEGGFLNDVVPKASLSASDEVVAAAYLSCTASASANVSTCESLAENVTCQLTELLATAIVTVKSVACTAVATCAELSGETTISGLAIGGVAVNVTGEANQVVQIPGVATLVINEQIYGAGEVTVNALHLTCLDSTEIIVASARARIGDCAPLPVEESTWGKVKSLYR